MTQESTKDKNGKQRDFKKKDERINLDDGVYSFSSQWGTTGVEEKNFNKILKIVNELGCVVKETA